MGYENSAGIKVYNHYGARDTGSSIGTDRVQHNIHQLKIAFTGDSINDDLFSPFVLPKGAKFLRYILTVDEAFAVSTSGSLTFGGTVPGTNGVVLTEAELEVAGTKAPASTGTGTWAVGSTTGTSAAEQVTQAISGTITAGVGKATLTAEYIYEHRA